MDYMTAAQHVSQQLAGLRSEQDPLVRAALRLAVEAWYEGVHAGVEAVRWGLFATAVEAVEATWWTGPPTHRICTTGCVAGVDLVGSVTQLVQAAAGVFARAAIGDDGETGWRLAASAAQLLAAADELEATDGRGRASGPPAAK
jgi:hypothetical protein